MAIIQNWLQSKMLTQIPHTKKTGRVRIDLFLWIQIPLLLLIPCITYYVAVSKGQVPGFPFSTITNTACPYPQNILFRFGMLTAASFLSLIFFCIFKWLVYEVRRIEFPEKVATWLYPLSQFSILAYSITIGTIDSKSTGKLHSPCAVIFFLILYGLTVHLTLFMKRMLHWKSNFITRESWWFKKLTCLYLSAIWMYCVVGLITENTQNKEDKYVVILEWNTVFVNILWLFSFRTDWKNVYLIVTGRKAFQIDRRQSS